MLHLVLVNGVLAVILMITYAVTKTRVRTALHLILIAMTIYGALTVWTTPNLETPF